MCIVLTNKDKEDSRGRFCALWKAGICVGLNRRRARCRCAVRVIPLIRLS